MNRRVTRRISCRSSTGAAAFPTDPACEIGPLFSLSAILPRQAFRRNEILPATRSFGLVRIALQRIGALAHERGERHVARTEELLQLMNEARDGAKPLLDHLDRARAGECHARDIGA